jgi:xanthine dehydrogenase accessory factor
VIRKVTRGEGHSSMKELDAVLRAIAGAQATRKRAALASVVSVSGSSYRRPGARMLVVEDGTTTGGVSGGCLESDVILRAAAAIEHGSVTLASYDTTGDDDVDFGVGLGCRGVIHVLIEPLPPAPTPPYLGLLENLRRAHEEAVLATVWRTGGGWGACTGNRLFQDSSGLRWTDIRESELAHAIAGDAGKVLKLRRSATMTVRSPTGEADVLLEYLPPSVSLLVFGAGPDAVPLVWLAQSLGWHVTVVDARAAAPGRGRFPEAAMVVVCGPEDVRAHVPMTSRSIAVVMSHNYRRDLALLETLLPSPVRYLGLLGPRARAERLLQDLSQTGLVTSPEQLRRVHAPAGLDLGGDGPEEIALAIVAEIQATLGHRAGGPLRDRPGPIHQREELPALG